MVRVAGVLVLLVAVGFPAAAPSPPVVAAAPPLCFTNGAISYQLAPTTVSADFRVKIAPHAADLRIELTDDVETSDFALVDDGAADAAPPDETCDGRAVRTVQAVDGPGPADMTVSLARASTDARDGEEGTPPLKLFVHSTRFGARDAAALAAVVRHDQLAGTKLAQAH